MGLTGEQVVEKCFFALIEKQWFIFEWEKTVMTSEKMGEHVSQEWGQQHFSFLDHSLKNKTFHSDADQKVRYRTFLGTLHFVLCLGFLLTKLNCTNFLSNRGANRNTVVLHTFKRETRSSSHFGNASISSPRLPATVLGRWGPSRRKPFI